MIKIKKHGKDIYKILNSPIQLSILKLNHILMIFNYLNHHYIQIHSNLYFYNHLINSINKFKSSYKHPNKKISHIINPYFKKSNKTSISLPIPKITLSYIFQIHEFLSLFYYYHQSYFISII